LEKPEILTTGLERDGPFFLHGFTARGGGVSVSPYDSLNPALHVFDDPDSVMANRQAICRAAGVPLESFVFCEQVHGGEVALVTAGDSGKGTSPDIAPVAGVDGLITSTPGVALGIFTADCAAVFLIDPDHCAVALVHAGWRGTAAGIVPQAIALMTKSFDTAPERLAVAFGPSIGPCCYTVGGDVRDAFLQTDRSVSPAFQQTDADHWRCDLKQANGLMAQGCGVPAANIRSNEICTACDTRFFSYRRDGGLTGRTLEFIVVRH
jgi:YfiH family protein